MENDVNKSKSKEIFNKIKILEEVQIDFNDDIKHEILHIKNGILEFIKANEYSLDGETIRLIEKEILSNVLELQLNLETIIVNFTRITGLKIVVKQDRDIQKINRFRKGQLVFLLDSNTSNTYSKVLLYLKSEINNKLKEFREDLGSVLDKIKNSEDIKDDILKLYENYFKINSELSEMIDDVNENISTIYDNISGYKDRNINLGFLLISAFLSVILFFPEFNNMLNLKYAEVSYNEKIDSIIYDKAIERLTIEDMMNIKNNTITEEMKEKVDINLVKGIIEKEREQKNKDLEREKDRINIFLMVLCSILIPYLLWIIFIAI